MGRSLKGVFHSVYKAFRRLGAAGGSTRPAHKRWQRGWGLESFQGRPSICGFGVSRRPRGRLPARASAREGRILRLGSPAGGAGPGSKASPRLPSARGRHTWQHKSGALAAAAGSGHPGPSTSGALLELGGQLEAAGRGPARGVEVLLAVHPRRQVPDLGVGGGGQAVGSLKRGVHTHAASTAERASAGGGRAGDGPPPSAQHARRRAPRTSGHLRTLATAPSTPPS
jgi:hypothetical protein